MAYQVYQSRVAASGLQPSDCKADFTCKALDLRDLYKPFWPGRDHVPNRSAARPLKSLMQHSAHSLRFAYTFRARRCPDFMPPITALLHTANDGLRLGRALETLRPCEEIFIVDHGSDDATVRIAREYGARILTFQAAANPANYLQSARYDWILCLDPRESLTEGMEASLYEWRSEPRPETANSAFSVFLREETADGWLLLPVPQTRLVPRTWSRWRGHLPAEDPSTYRAALPLEGELLRFLLP
jgi:hypothetical protein